MAEATVLAPAGHGFDEAALAAVRQFRFTPGRADGKPVPVKVTYRYAFVLQARRRRRRCGRRRRAAGAPARQGDRARHAQRRRRRGGDRARRARRDARRRPRPASTARSRCRWRSAGAVTVVVAAPDHKTLRVHETLGAREALDGALRDLAHELRAATSRRCARRRCARRSRASRSTGDEVRRIPGTRGDALAAVLESAVGGALAVRSRAAGHPRLGAGRVGRVPARHGHPATPSTSAG